MNLSVLATLLAGSLLLAAPARAQRAFRFGATGGATLATVHFADLPDQVTTPLRAGGLGGATGTYQSRGHWGAQLAVLYAQQGYARHYASSSGYSSDDQVRLNYLRLPVLATFSQHAGGRGLQAFAGPYVGVLLGGNRTHATGSPTSSYAYSDRVVVADEHPQPVLFYDYYGPAYVLDNTGYSRRFDAGLQGGVGYRLGSTLLQVGYTWGLRNLATTTVYEAAGITTYRVAGEPYRTRGWQVALTYLLGPKS